MSARHARRYSAIRERFTARRAQFHRPLHRRVTLGEAMRRIKKALA